MSQQEFQISIENVLLSLQALQNPDEQIRKQVNLLQESA